MDKCVLCGNEEQLHVFEKKHHDYNGDKCFCSACWRILYEYCGKSNDWKKPSKPAWDEIGYEEPLGGVMCDRW